MQTVCYVCTEFFGNSTCLSIFAFLFFYFYFQFTCNFAILLSDFLIADGAKRSMLIVQTKLGFCDKMCPLKDCDLYLRGRDIWTCYSIHYHNSVVVMNFPNFWGPLTEFFFFCLNPMAKCVYS